MAVDARVKSGEMILELDKELATYRATAAHFLDRGFTRRFLLLKELTQELIKQEKQAYEQLIRMLSHEINNSIGAINSILHSFLHYAPQLAPADQPDFIQALDVRIARNTQLTNFIANFAHLVRLPPSTFVIENDGANLSLEVSQRLFTPFFSTKRDGQGICLTLVRDILLAHGFIFQLATEVHGRTAFRVKL